MPPADDQIASFHVVHVPQKVAAFLFKFDFHELASIFTDAAHGFTVGKLRLQLCTTKPSCQAIAPKRNMTLSSLSGA
jgi:hypothetical protein